MDRQQGLYMEKQDFDANNKNTSAKSETDIQIVMKQIYQWCDVELDSNHHKSLASAKLLTTGNDSNCSTMCV